jgi:hypothetical protein
VWAAVRGCTARAREVRAAVRQEQELTRRAWDGADLRGHWRGAHAHHCVAGTSGLLGLAVIC